MAKISNRNDFRDYVLRRLGYPVIEINVDDDQIEDRIDDGLQLFREYLKSRWSVKKEFSTCINYSSNG